MPPTNPRIIIVDDNQAIYDVVRLALEFMGRRPRLIHVRTADDAAAELQLATHDLLITAATLPGETDGHTLAMYAKRELAALPVVVVANENDPLVDDEILAQQPYDYLRRPFVPEVFLRVLRIALDGPEAVPQESTPTEMLIPVPQIDVDQIRPLLFRMMRDVNAMAAVMADRNGKVIAYEGAAGYIDRDTLAAILASGFGSTMKMLDTLGEQPRVLKYFEGQRGHLFGLAVGLHHFVILVYDQNPPAAVLGNVKRFGGMVVNEMLGLITPEVAFSRPNPVQMSVQPPAPAPAPAKKEMVERVGRSRRGEETPRAVENTAPAEKPTHKAGSKRGTQVMQAPPPEPEIEERVIIPSSAPNNSASIDPSLFEALDNLDLSAADALFDPNNLNGSGEGGLASSKISFEDALMQGIIGSIEE
jgi:CheY-like chemotaxis protein